MPRQVADESALGGKNDNVVLGFWNVAITSGLRVMSTLGPDSEGGRS